MGKSIHDTVLSFLGFEFFFSVPGCWLNIKMVFMLVIHWNLGTGWHPKLYLSTVYN